LINLSEKEKIELDWWKSQSFYGKNCNEKGNPSIRAYEKYRNIVLLAGGDKYSFDGKTIIDLGCGPMGALHFFPNTSIKIGIDNLAFNYNQVFEVKKKQHVEYVAADGEFLPISDECADYVFCINAFDHVDEPNTVANELERILKPKGILFLQVEINKRATTINEPHLFSTEIILNLFQNLSLIRHKIIPNQKMQFFRKIFRLSGFYPRYNDLFIGSFKK